MSNYTTTGILEISDLTLPAEERLKRGAIAIIECVQRIPCNPCEAACPKGAIIIGEDINEIPILDAEKCNGCGLCIANCPGLAIFVVDYNYSDTEARVMLPYEYLPLPKVNEIVSSLNRAGEIIGEAKVIKVLNTKAFDRTPVITILVPQELAMEIRNIKLR